jgi:hypothetical protein
MSVGIVTVAYGDTYRAFLPEWLEAVNQLTKKPDQITIVTDQINKNIALDNLVWVEAQGIHKIHPQIYVNQAITATDTDWICKMDVDDLIRPHALNNFEKNPCDVYMFGMYHNKINMYAQKITAQHVIESRHNLVFSGSPFRKWVWKQAPFLDMIYEDWLFWIEAAKNGATFCQSETIDYEYRTHSNNISNQHDSNYWTEIVRSLR